MQAHPSYRPGLEWAGEILTRIWPAILARLFPGSVLLLSAFSPASPSPYSLSTALAGRPELSGGPGRTSKAFHPRESARSRSESYAALLVEDQRGIR